MAAHDWSADGNEMLLTLEHSAVVSEVYLLDVASGPKQKLRAGVGGGRMVRAAVLK